MVQYRIMTSLKVKMEPGSCYFPPWSLHWGSMSILWGASLLKKKVPLIYGSSTVTRWQTHVWGASIPQIVNLGKGWTAYYWLYRTKKKHPNWIRLMPFSFGIIKMVIRCWDRKTTGSYQCNICQFLHWRWPWFTSTWGPSSGKLPESGQVGHMLSEKLITIDSENAQTIGWSTANLSTLNKLGWLYKGNLQNLIKSC